MSATTTKFNPEIPSDELPPEWTVEHIPHSDVYTLEAPGAAHVILQVWEDDYAVTPMKPVTDSPATAQSDTAHIEQFENIENAISYALKQATRLE